MAMKTYISNHVPENQFDKERCKTCKAHEMVEDRVVCTNMDAAHHIISNTLCEVYDVCIERIKSGLAGSRTRVRIQLI